MHTITLHGRLQHRFRLNQVGQRAEAAYGSIIGSSPWMAQLGLRLNALMNENASIRSRFAKLNTMASEIATAISPHAACAPQCAQCCHISVALSALEAQRIASAYGLSITPAPGDQDEAVLQRTYFGEPCPFVHDNQCSIYEHRPLACRLHFSLDADAYFCQTDIAPEDSAVPNVDMRAFWLTYAVLSMNAGSTIGDIRQFFPNGLTPARPSP